MKTPSVKLNNKNWRNEKKGILYVPERDFFLDLDLDLDLFIYVQFVVQFTTFISADVLI